jgi:hypothetical protein
MPVKPTDKNIEASNLELEPTHVIIFVNIYHPSKFVMEIVVRKSKTGSRVALPQLCLILIQIYVNYSLNGMVPYLF